MKGNDSAANFLVSALRERLADSRITDVMFPTHWTTMLATVASVIYLLISLMSKVEDCIETR